MMGGTPCHLLSILSSPSCLLPCMHSDWLPWCFHVASIVYTSPLYLGIHLFPSILCVHFDSFVVSKYQEPNTQWRSVTSQKNGYFIHSATKTQILLVLLQYEAENKAFLIHSRLFFTWYFNIVQCNQCEHHNQTIVTTVMFVFWISPCSCYIFWPLCMVMIRELLNIKAENMWTYCALYFLGYETVGFQVYAYEKYS